MSPNKSDTNHFNLKYNLLQRNDFWRVATL